MTVEQVTGRVSRARRRLEMSILSLAMSGHLIWVRLFWSEDAQAAG
jgi:hypothetical protein